MVDENGKLFYETGKPPMLITDECGGTCCKGGECRCPDGSPKPDYCCGSNPGGLGCGCDEGGGGNPPGELPPGGGVLPPCCPDECPGPWCDPPDNTGVCGPRTCHYYLYAPLVSGTGSLTVDYKQFRNCGSGGTCVPLCVGSGSGGGLVGGSVTQCSLTTVQSDDPMSFTQYSCSAFPPQMAGVGYRATFGTAIGSVGAVGGLGTSCFVCLTSINGNNGTSGIVPCGAEYQASGSLVHFGSGVCSFYTPGNITSDRTVAGACGGTGSISANAQLLNYYRC